nr:hypothetical protein [Acidipila sp. EB88]
MLVPEIGDSTVIRIAMRAPTATPVKAIRREDRIKNRISAMRSAEISVSARNAIKSPLGPGTVTA